MEKRKLDAHEENFKNRFKVFKELVKGPTYSKDGEQLLLKAFAYAEKNHKGILRKSGEEYIIHPLEVAITLLTWQSGVNTVAAGLLHDLIEDTPVTYEDIVKEFNTSIASIVDSVTKVSKKQFSNSGVKVSDSDKDKDYTETLKKIYSSLSYGVEALTVKLADRLHNTQTLDWLSPEKQKKIAQETLDIYAPIAARLGMYDVKRELEDNSFKYNQPEKYLEVINNVEESIEKKHVVLSNVENEIKDLFKEHGIKIVTMNSRVKNFYSIYKKMYHNGIPFNEIKDIIAIRIITNSVSECYEILGLIHQRFKIYEKGFKDYIANPKFNLYQSIHTIIIANGEFCEVQIRTTAMDEIANYGVASHWLYKDAKSLQEKESIVDFFKNVLSSSGKDTDDTKNIIDIARKDIFKQSINVYDKQTNKQYEISKDATALDFAFLVDAEKALKVSSIELNGSQIAMNEQLKDNDVVKINYSETINLIHEWLKKVRTSYSKNIINQELSKRDNTHVKLDNDIKLIHNEFIKKLQSDHAASKLLPHKKALKRMQKNQVVSPLELYKLIASGTLTIDEAIKFFYYKSVAKSELKEMREKINRKEINLFAKRFISLDLKIPVQKIYFAKCCYPVPTEDIIGLKEEDQIIVHRTDCLKLLDQHRRNIIPAKWIETQIGNTFFKSILSLRCTDRINLLIDILQMAKNQKVYLDDVKITHIEALVEESSIANDIVDITLFLRVSNKKTLDMLRHSLAKVDGVIKTARNLL